MPRPEPLAFLRLAGHHVRWALLAELARSDRTVQELTDRVSERQNLVSYHLAKLRDAGLVSARRSSADGRDAYYTLDLARVGACLTATGGALHPALAPAPPAPPAAPLTSRARVLFLCTGNSGRSPMAEALLRAFSGGAVEVHSAGSRPKPLHPTAVRVLRERYGIDIAGRRPRHLDEFVDQRFDWVVTLCDRVREVCPEFPGPPQAVHWSIPDPASDPDGDAAFERTAADLEARVGPFLRVATAAPTHPNPPEEAPWLTPQPS